MTYDSFTTLFSTDHPVRLLELSSLFIYKGIVLRKSFDSYIHHSNNLEMKNDCFRLEIQNEASYDILFSPNFCSVFDYPR